MLEVFIEKVNLLISLVSREILIGDRINLSVLQNIFNCSANSSVKKTF